MHPLTGNWNGSSAVPACQTDIINEIGRLRSQGLVVITLGFLGVQAILRQLETRTGVCTAPCGSAVLCAPPDAVSVPADGRASGWVSQCKTLTSTQTDIVQRLTMNLMGQLTDAHSTVLAGLKSALLGRTEPDIYRRVGLEQVAEQQAAGRGINQSVPAFVDALRREGVTAFTDKAGRNWSLHTYATMVSRSTSRQAEILSVITADPNRICPDQRPRHHPALCAPYEAGVQPAESPDPPHQTSAR
ncbi:MAG: phage minor capsid protein [Ruthenibacterium lactatiformans]